MTTSLLAGLELSGRSPELMEELEAISRQVEDELNRVVETDVKLVSDVARHTLRSGGKRLRPAFVSLAARAAGKDFDQEQAVRVGVAMELIHMATLVHDDVIDNADLRRGRPTAGAVFGNTAAVLSGDAFLGRAVGLLVQDRDSDVIAAVAEAVQDMAIGEVREVETRGLFDLSEQDHLWILDKKTASFIRCCCRVGAVLAGAPQPTRDSLASFGYHLGMAFQIADDILDYRGRRDMTGKSIGTDFREGCATLPLIRLRPKISEAEREVVEQKFGNGVTEDEIRMIGSWMEARGAFEESENVAREHVRAACKAIRTLPDSPARDILDGLAEFALERKA